ncbi:MAG: pyridoxamine 5'-phosphate oxidase family protein [Hyphomicrobiaceae bacterium]|nr:pyridoxamine 5'-phosphate oxidase family protein [Hyphomicrobiaceae bacterium]
MGHRFAKIAFTPTVKAMQEQNGSRPSYARLERHEVSNDRLSAREAAFITARDSFYMASVGETGWPYIQHRGGPTGFVRVLDEHNLGFADFRGNRQYVSVGNLVKDDRVSLFFMDYANRNRLKLLGRVTLVEATNRAVLERLVVPGYRAAIERGFLITVEAFDWNCSQHITPRFTAGDFEDATSKLRQRIADLEAQLAQSRTAGS